MIALAADPIQFKLAENARLVDSFIDKILTPRRPEALYEASRHLVMAGGKRIRPFLVVKACEAVGGDPADAIPFAAGLELLHNFTLVHDDVMDNDPVRRGSPTVHVKYGVPLAICAGDLLYAKVYEAFTVYAPPKLSAGRIRRCVEYATRATVEVCEGQVLDMSFPGMENVSEEDYVAMVGGKTSALFRGCAEVGATVGGGTAREVKALGGFVYDAGIAFQIADDILGVTADEKTLGKPVGSDIREGKKTIIMLHALRHAKAGQAKMLNAVLGNRQASKEDLLEAENLLKEIGSVDYASRKADVFLAQGKKRIHSLRDSDAKRSLIELVDYFTKRNY